ncbi:Rab GTPase TBC domain [Trypanosoma vivax]|uniref:Putative rab-like GTPase activating protein n=1 Tax=Trypanosoma vivax (strain Y486) TaxID=1055687 RepID=G0U7F0_TRYVY|nr:putative rab-like GTPase activating protein [Trypanosoma vivax]KAH8620752.1 Rab GTPase TBC domain [Trypanosoma vivax]CCC51808.1 putative rab-like GTPase activating protein [Trypanosoma vivax Y486]
MTGPHRIPLSTVGRTTFRPNETSVTDRYGFYISPEEKAMEEEYIRAHPENAKIQKKWTSALLKWDRISQNEKKALCRQGIPQSRRKTVWPLLLMSYGWEMSEHVAYGQLKTQTIADESVRNMIERDLCRTFPTHRLFAERDGVMQEKLRGVLRAYANHNSSLGYVQGMAFLAATLLLQIEDEESTFWAFVSLMDKPRYLMRSMYVQGFPALFVRFHQLRKLMARHCKRILEQLEEYNIEFCAFAAPWYMTLFSYSLNFTLLSRVWDMFLCEGWKVIHRLAVAFLLLHKEPLERARSEDEFLMALKNIHDKKDPDVLLKKALWVSFKTRELGAWEREHAMSFPNVG